MAPTTPLTPPSSWTVSSSPVSVSPPSSQSSNPNILNGKLPITNHESLYLPDGNIVLLASPSSKPTNSSNSFTAFRVHQSLLGRHSSVLGEMLTNATELLDATTVDEYDGVPCIHMSDTAEEIECLLKYIYGDLTLPIRRLTTDNMHTIRLLLTLSKKYAIPTIRRQLIPRLEQDWPPTLFRWDSLELEISGLLSLWSSDPLPSYFDDDLPEPAEAIRLGFECRVPSILPAAFYHLSRLEIFDDRSQAKANPEYLVRRVLEKRKANWKALKVEDFIRLLKGKHHLLNAGDNMVFDEPRLCSLQKHFHNAVGDERRRLCSIEDQWLFWKEVKETWKSGSSKSSHTNNDILKFLNNHAENVQSRAGICERCRTDIQKALKDMREEIWRNLPAHFELAS